MVFALRFYLSDFKGKHQWLQEARRKYNPYLHFLKVYITNSASPTPVWTTVRDKFLTKISFHKTLTSASLYANSS